VSLSKSPTAYYHVPIYYSESIGDVKKTDLPGPEALERPGNKDGQVIMIRTAAGSVEAHEVRWVDLCLPLANLTRSGRPAKVNGSR
jgi:hypothetical protein